MSTPATDSSTGPFRAVPLLWATLFVGGFAGTAIGIYALASDNAGIPKTWSEALASAPGVVALLAAIVTIDQILVQAGELVTTSDGEGEVATYGQLRATAPVLTSATAFAYLMVTLIGAGGSQMKWAFGILAYVGVLIFALIIGKFILSRKPAQRAPAASISIKAWRK